MPIKYKRAHVLNIVLVLESALLLVATLWAYVARIDLLTGLSFFPPELVLAGIGLGLATSLLSLGLTLFTKRFRDRFPRLASLDEFVTSTLYPIFAEVTQVDIFLIALASGFCEEVFFRGVLQQQFGLLIASLIFGLFHYGKKFMLYTVWATLAGLVLGLSFDLTHNLWVPVLAHATNNLISISLVRYRIGYRS